MSKRTSADWGSRVKRKKQRIPAVGCSLWPHCPTAVLHDSVAIETAVKKGRRWRAKRARPLLFLLDGVWGGVLPDPFAVLAGARDTGSHGRLLSGRLQRPLPLPASLTRLLEVETDEIDEPFELGRRSSESDDYYYLLTLTHRPPAHRRLCHAWRAWPSIRGANTVEIQLKKVDMSSVFFFIQMVGQCLFPL